MNNIIPTIIFAILLVMLPFTAKPGDTIFTNPPDLRFWNPDYMQTVFIDNFKGDKLDTSVWYIDLCKSRGFNGNNEGSNQNIEVSNGSLKLWARYEPANIDSNCWENTHFESDYTTAEIYTLWDRYKYGSFEAKCRVPCGEHFFYAYWLWGPGGNGYPSDGFTSEIDIVEGVEWSDGTNHEMKSAFHYWSHTDGEIALPDSWQHGYDTIYEGDWHKYKIIWNPYEVLFVFDNETVWKRTKYHTGEDLRKNDIGMNELETGVQYSGREYFPNHEMETVFQMHIKENIDLDELPAAMEIDYVKVRQFFLSPVIACPEIITDVGQAILDVDERATNIKWRLESDDMFEVYEGTGKVAEIIPKPGEKGDANIIFTFQMPTGEFYKAETDFLVEKPVTAGQIALYNEFSELNLNILPNPAGDWVIIDPETKGKWSIEIYSTNMNLMRIAENISAENYRLNVSNWKPGVYLVFIRNENSIFTGKLVVKQTGIQY